MANFSAEVVGQFFGSVLGKVVVEDVFEIWGVEGHFDNGNFAEEVLLDSQGFLLEEDVSVDLDEVLEQFWVGQVAVSSEELQVEVAFVHLVGLQDRRLIHVLLREIARCICVLLLFKHQVFVQELLQYLLRKLAPELREEIACG